jgi:hypothetical protein
MRRTLALSVALLAATACGDATTEPLRVDGTYQLTRVNGVATPAPLPGGVDGTAARVTGGFVTLEPTGVWRAEVRLVVGPDGAGVTVSDLHAGRYTVSRDTVRLRDDVEGGTFVAVARGARLSATVESVVFDFDR